MTINILMMMMVVMVMTMIFFAARVRQASGLRALNYAVRSHLHIYIYLFLYILCCIASLCRSHGDPWCSM